MSGADIVRGTRIPAQAVADIAEDGYAGEQIVAQIYPSLPRGAATRVIAFASAQHAGSHSV
jgi:uncharacterized protein (DUF433 family)